MDVVIRPFRTGMLSDDTAAVAALWNAAAAGTHGFFPLDPSLLRTRIVRHRRFHANRLLLATAAGEPVGMLHWDAITDSGWESAATVEAWAVRPDARLRGIGSALLAAALPSMQEEPVAYLDGGGGWPCSPFWTTLIEGSERSGPFLNDAASLRLFGRAGFAHGRESLVLRRPVSPADRAAAPAGTSVRIAPRNPAGGWLDFVFRGWALQDHALVLGGGLEASHAVFARMEPLSTLTGRAQYALFGVGTPTAMRRRGWAKLNLRLLLGAIAAEGGEEVELHVYADNEPAVGLYLGLGFREVGRTVLMRRDPS